MFRTLADLDGAQRLLVRVDVNAAVDDGTVRDGRRFAAHAATLDRLAAAGHAVVCLAHQGRPGRPDFLPLAQHATILESHVDREVTYVPETTGPDALDAVEGAAPGDVVLLENVRMTDDELADRDPAGHAASDLVTTLAERADAYVNDAYSAAHRAQASLVGFPEVLPSYAGPVMADEYEANTSIRSRSFDGDVTLVLGGVKVGDLVPAVDALADRVDHVLLGGVLGELALRARGHPVGHDVGGTDLYDRTWDAVGDELERTLDAHGDLIETPVDLAFAVDGERREVAVGEIDGKERPFRDVGTETTMRYAATVRDSAAVFVKGALGAFETEPFAVGTVGLFEAVADTDCFSVVGGGDTARVIDLHGLDESRFSHVSLAGGAYLRALTGAPLPAVTALERAADRMRAGD